MSTSIVALLAEATELTIESYSPEREPELHCGDGAIRVSAPDITRDEIELVTRVLEDGWISGSAPVVHEFEENFAQSVGVAHAVTCNSGGSALTLMLRAAAIGEGDEVIVPAYTMIATAGAVSLLGAIPVFVDCDPATLNIDPVSVRRAISKRTKAVMAVHVYGRPCDIEALRTICSEHGLLLFEDSAEAHGSMWRGRSCGALSMAAAFGFYGNKTITTGEGGIVTTNDTALADRVRDLRSYCFGKDRHFWHGDIGFSYRMSGLQAALGLAQLRRLKVLVERRRQIANRYSDLLAAEPRLRRCPAEETEALNSYWFYFVRVDDRASVRATMARDNIETRAGFAPLHKQPCYVSGRWHSRTVPSECLAAEDAGRDVLLLPTHTRLTEADQFRVVASLRRALRS